MQESIITMSYIPNLYLNLKSMKIFIDQMKQVKMVIHIIDIGD